MVKIFIKLLASAGAILGIAYLFTEITVTDFKTAIWVALVLAAFSFTIKPIMKLITLPINLITFGLFGLVINAGLLWTASFLVDGFVINTPTAAFLGALIILVVNKFIHNLLKQKSD